MDFNNRIQPFSVQSLEEGGWEFDIFTTDTRMWRVKLYHVNHWSKMHLTPTFLKGKRTHHLFMTIFEWFCESGMSNDIEYLKRTDVHVSGNFGTILVCKGYNCCKAHSGLMQYALSNSVKVLSMINVNKRQAGRKRNRPSSCVLLRSLWGVYRYLFVYCWVQMLSCSYFPIDHVSCGVQMTVVSLPTSFP